MTEPDQACIRPQDPPIAPTVAPIIHPAAEAAEISRRTEAWAASLQPGDSLRAWIAGQVVIASVRLDRCTHLERARRRRLAARAATCWDEDRRLEAEVVAQRLAHKPALTVRLLRKTSQGCDWLIARWEGLMAILADSGSWDDSRRSLAFDLLGVPPGERQGDPLQTEANPDVLAELARREVAELEERKADTLDDLDAQDRALAVEGLGDDASPEARLLIRYEASCRKVFHWGLAQLVPTLRAPKASATPLGRPIRPRPPAPPAPARALVPTPTGPPMAPRPIASSAASTSDRRTLAPATASPPPASRNRRARRALAKLARSA